MVNQTNAEFYMKIDLHCHTNISDGSLPPEKLIDLAIEKEVDCLAITDHDTTLSYELIKSYANQVGLTLLSGTEISCQWQGRTIHIVGLCVDVENPILQAGLKWNRVLRWQRAFEISARFAKRNIDGMLSSVIEQIDVGMIGRNHFAYELVQRNLVKDTQQAFDRYLKEGRPAYAKVDWPELTDVVGWITAAGGKAVIAHPHIYKMTSNKLNLMIEDFKAAGGEGIEVVCQPRVCSDQIGMADRAQRHGLLASQGSDFHRPEQSWRSLGWLAPMPEKCQPIWEKLPCLSGNF